MADKINSRTSLNSVDWDFVRASRGKSIHPYPAKFIPEIPRNLIDIYHPGDSSIVLDPFCGSGTTLVEANRKGLDAWGIDLNPLACLISRVATTPLPLSAWLEKIGKEIIEKAENNLKNGIFTIPRIPRLDHWFQSDVQRALAVLIEQINEEEQLPVREALQVALSSIIVQVSNQESDTRYAAIQKDISSQYVFDRFKIGISNVARLKSSLCNSSLAGLGKTTVMNRDILAVTAEDLPRNIGLVVTSPPYPNAYEYWLYHKYRMYWLGMDPLYVREREIGARPHYFGKNHQDEHDFERQMSSCFKLLSQIITLNGKACFIIGRSIIHGREIDNVALLQRSAKPHGFVMDDLIQRNILTSRKTFNLSHGKINQEHVVVFSRGGGF